MSFKKSFKSQVVFFSNFGATTFFLNLFLKHVGFRHLLVPLWTWRFGRNSHIENGSNGPSWAVRIASVADSCLQTQHGLTKRIQPTQCWTFSNTVGRNPKKNNQYRLDVFPTLVNYGVLNYQPLRLIGFMNHQFIAYLPSSFRGTQCSSDLLLRFRKPEAGG